MFVACDSNGITYTSPDALTWQNNGLINPALGFGNETCQDGHIYNGLFIFGGFSGYVYLSRDGVHWSTPVRASAPFEINNVGVGGGVVIVASSLGRFDGGPNGVSRIWRSTDNGYSWSDGIQIPDLQHFNNLTDVTALCFAVNTWIAGSYGLSRSQDNGLTWQPNIIPSGLVSASGDIITSILFKDGVLAAGTVCSTVLGTPGSVSLSTNFGSSWSAAAPLAGLTAGAGCLCGAVGFGLFIFGIGQFADAAGTGNGHVFWSTDGKAWTDAGDITGAGIPLQSMSFDGTMFCCGDFAGKVYRSLDGKSWGPGVSIAPADAVIYTLQGVPVPVFAGYSDRDHRSPLNTAARPAARANALRRGRRALRVPVLS